jgi:hypothetical protein
MSLWVGAKAPPMLAKVKDGPAPRMK